MTKGPMVKSKVMGFYGENEIEVATEANLIRLATDGPATHRYLTPDAADALAHALSEAAKVVRARWKRDGR